MSDVFISSDNIITSLGFTTKENALNMLSGKTGISLIEDDHISPSPFYGSLVDTTRLINSFSEIYDPGNFTRFEQLAILSISDALAGAELNTNHPGTLFILSTTKGNIDLLETRESISTRYNKLYLWNTAKLICNVFKFRNEPVVISNACISGAQAIVTGARLIRAGHFDTVIINGTDIISEFVVSGFNSFKSLSNGPCRPFDKTRDGLSLGEGSGTIILTSKPDRSKSGRKEILAGEGLSSNDANHISGPSRTGEGLFLIIERLLKKTSGHIDFVSAHGTGTIYNDEMESVAITRTGLQEVPVNSFKGYWGHTLGAAGIVESIMCVYSMREDILFKTEGFFESGMKNPLNIIDKVIEKKVNNCLKISSGFGGCNTALLFHGR